MFRCNRPMTMNENHNISEFMQFFQAIERSQRVREDCIERHARPHLESGTLPTPEDVLKAINSLVGNRRLKLLRCHKYWKEHTLREGLDSLFHSAHQASIDVSRHDAALSVLADSADFQNKVDLSVGYATQKDIVA